MTEANGVESGDASGEVRTLSLLNFSLVNCKPPKFIVLYCSSSKHLPPLLSFDTKHTWWQEMSSDKPSPEDVEALLAARRKVQEKPNTDALLPVYLYLLHPSNEAQSSSSSLEDHWYCNKSKSALHTEAATYLIFLFAFQRQGTSKTWVDKLEVILESCENCARSFGGARRRLEFRFVLLSSRTLLSNCKSDISLNGQHTFGRISLRLLIGGKALSFSIIQTRPMTEGMES